MGWVLFWLNFLDLGLTMIGVSLGGVKAESNPWIRWLLNQSPLLACLIKALVGVLMLTVPWQQHKIFGWLILIGLSFAVASWCWWFYLYFSRS